MLQFAVPGDLLSTNAEQFRVSAGSMVDAHRASVPEWDAVEVDLERAHMVDSAGLNALIGLLKTLKNQGRRMIIRVADPHVHRVLIFTRMDRQAEVIKT
ncbi:MAG: STAS domain-containing protein [Bryobacteraceae bacterium]